MGKRRDTMFDNGPSFASEHEANMKQYQEELGNLPPDQCEYGTIGNMDPRGFGFLRIPGQSGDLYFHASGLEGVAFAELRKGQRVSFQRTMGPRGPRAVSVQLVKE